MVTRWNPTRVHRGTGTVDFTHDMYTWTTCHMTTADRLTTRHTAIPTILKTTYLLFSNYSQI